MGEFDPQPWRPKTKTIVVPYPFAVPRARGDIGLAVCDLTGKGKTTREIYACLMAAGVSRGSIKVAINRLRERGAVPLREKVRARAYQITLPDDANARLARAAQKRGLHAFQLARILLHQATKSLEA